MARTVPPHRAGKPSRPENGRYQHFGERISAQGVSVSPPFPRGRDGPTSLPFRCGVLFVASNCVGGSRAFACAPSSYDLTAASSVYPDFHGKRIAQSRGGGSELGILAWRNTAQNTKEAARSNLRTADAGSGGANRSPSTASNTPLRKSARASRLFHILDHKPQTKFGAYARPKVSTCGRCQ